MAVSCAHVKAYVDLVNSSRRLIGALPALSGSSTDAADIQQGSLAARHRP